MAQETTVSQLANEVTDTTGIEDWYLYIEEPSITAKDISYKIKRSVLLEGLLYPDVDGIIQAGAYALDINEITANSVETGNFSATAGVVETLDYTDMKVPGYAATTLSISGTVAGAVDGWAISGVDISNFSNIPDYQNVFQERILTGGDSCIDLGSKAGLFHLDIFLPIGVNRPNNPITNSISITDNSMRIIVTLGIYNSSLNTFTTNTDVIHSLETHYIANNRSLVSVPDGTMGNDITAATSGKLRTTFFHRYITLGENESFATKVGFSLEGTYTGVGDYNTTYSGSVVHSGATVLPTINITRGLN